jgi:hypothetical protein
MKSYAKWLGAVVAVVLLAGTSAAADAIAAGKVKTINANKKEVVVTDDAGKDLKFKLGANVVINRGGKESKSDLNVGDAVNVLYDKGVLTWTARYFLVQEGDTKNCELMHGTFKGYDVGKKHVSFTDAAGKDVTFPMGDARVRLNMKDSKVEDVKIGDHTLAIVEKVGDKVTLKAVMIERK